MHATLRDIGWGYGISLWSYVCIDYELSTSHYLTLNDHLKSWKLVYY